MCEIKKKCTCGYECLESEMVVKQEVVTESVPMHDYNDLTPSNLIKYEDKHRLIHIFSCPNCNNILFRREGILV